jgi:outer membrane protein TolC
MKTSTICVVVIVMVAHALAAFSQEPGQSPSTIIVDAVSNPECAAVLRDVIERNPDVGVARAQAAAADQRAPQVSSLPDPTAAFTLFLQTPETRVGPQYATVSLSQRFPWFGTLGIREQAALAEAAAARSDVASIELRQITEARLLLHELQFLEAREGILSEEADTLDHFEELSRARYASGVGLDQAVIKIQAEIARNQAQLLDLEATRADLTARLNALRDRAGAPVPEPTFSSPPIRDLDVDELRATAFANRPEMAASRARLAAAERRIEIADKAFGPELSAGIIYSAIGSRSDADPPDEGQDVFGISGGVSLPVWRERRHAGVEEAVQARLAAEQLVRSTEVSIEEEIADLARRIPLIQERLALFDGVLVVQAEESLASALSAYSAGTAGALDLLDAERVLFQVRVAAARSRADLHNAIAHLERAVARPVGEGVSR